MLVLPPAWAMDITVKVKHEAVPDTGGTKVIIAEVIDAALKASMAGLK